jgi:DNA-binding XRE family transcriptional regulator
MTLGEIIRHYRKKRKLSQGTLAHATQLSRVTIGSLETDVRKPSWEHVVTICRALGVSTVILDPTFRPHLETALKKIQMKEFASTEKALKALLTELSQ